MKVPSAECHILVPMSFPLFSRHITTPGYSSRVTPTIDAAAFDRATEPVLKILSRDQALKIIDFHGEENLQQRIEELARKANEGELTEEERAEYQGYAQANKFIAVLQAKARRLLAS